MWEIIEINQKIFNYLAQKMFETPEFGDSTVTCPYNSSHIISKSRIQKHIVKCEKNYPVGYKVLCPYNGTHRIFPSELKDHTANCPSRKMLEAESVEAYAALKCSSIRSHLTINDITDVTDDWDKQNSLSNFSLDVSALRDTERTQHVFECTKKLDIENMPIRPPRGYSEAAMRDTEEEYPFEDTESIVSAMAIGRGKLGLQRQYVHERLGRGRGLPLNKNF